MSSDDVLLEVRGLSKCFQIYDKPSHRFMQFVLPRLQRAFGLRQSVFMHDFWALHDVSFRIRRGETVGIIGRNGSGKSTLLQMVCSTLTPTSGEVSINGRIAALLELGAGFNPEFSGRDNVFLAGSIAGISQQEMRNRFSDIEAFADIGEFINQPVKTYSSGMFVRLAFATAIHTSPDILVVDEALAVGDTAFQTKCLTRIRELQRLGVTILLVTHSTNTLIEYCDRAIYLRRGVLVQDGICKDVVKQYANDLVEEEGGVALDEGVPQDSVSEIEVDQGCSKGIAINNVEILDISGQPRKTFEHGDSFTVKVTLLVHNPVEAPCFGMQIKSVDDIVLWSATTQQMNISLGCLKAGDFTVTWSLNANFGGNRYVLAIGVGDIDNGEYKRHVRLPYAGYIDIVPQENCGSGWLSPNPSVSLIKS
ncbi:polysaccharide/polyol phosphate ABC transporter ATP-binding protein [Limnohabitans sp. T6-5]|uniref:ABC transporter ATP-binding protein n=1 Tax=Limnohabitans sp. T6-5 TaxID=1100724 RepID=UPI000D393A0B|nr:ABC transporter ATP-binding protein [Limnohabitans sp. T6-5]PUE09145.1 polysaccharide/polyol phosphate ABC transporter ATP-binding protein [Limnohabitans sp. T6-5]